MANKAKIYSNTGWYSFSIIMSQLIGIISLPILTLYLSPDEFGIVALVTTFNTLAASLGSLQIFKSVIRLYYDYDEERKRDFFSTLFYTVIIFGVLIFIILQIAGNFFIQQLFTDDISFYPYFFIGSFYIVFALPRDLTTEFFKAQERAKRLAIISAFSTVIGFSMSLIFVVALELGATGQLIAISSNAFIFMIVHLIHFRKLLKLKFDLVIFKESLKFSLPVIPHALGGYLFMYSDKILLQNLLPFSSDKNLYMIGLYHIAERLASQFKNVVNSFSRANAPQFMKLAQDSWDKAKDFSLELSESWFVVVGILFFMLANFSEVIVYLLTEQQYHQAWMLIPIIGISYVFRAIYILPINTFYFLKKTVYLPRATIFAGLLNVGLNFIFIPVYGIYGAAVSTAISFFVNWLCIEWLTKYTFRIKYDKISSLILFLLIIVSLVSSYMVRLESIWLTTFMNLGLLLVLGGTIYLFNIKNTKIYIKKKLNNVFRKNNS